MLRELITEEEYEAMENYRLNYAYLGDWDNNRKVSIKDVLSHWEENKIDLFNLLGRQLQITKDIHYAISRTELVSKMQRINSRYSKAYFGREQRNCSHFVNSWFNWVDSFCKEKNIFKNSLRDLILNPYNLADNIYRGNPISIPLPNEKNYVITDGCKIIKAIGKIASIFNIEGFEDFRICHSLVLNDNKIKGKLTLSIHPLDYWTMSDNENDWTSCMSWKENGSYRQGTVEMMNSPSVIVAYLSAEEPMLLGDDYPWNNKKWRQLFIVDKDFIMGIKAYPYQNDYLTKEVLKWIAELGKINLNWHYDDEFYIYSQHKIFNVSKNIIRNRVYFSTKKMYNDVGCCSEHWLLLNTKTCPKIYFFLFSGESQCVNCGTIDTHLLSDNENALCCKRCDESHYCCCCGNFIERDDVATFDGQEYCSSCYAENVCLCDICEEEQFIDNTTFLKIILEKNGSTLLVANDYLNLCSDCFEKIAQTIPIYNDCYVFLDDLRDYVPRYLAAYKTVQEIPHYFYYKEEIVHLEQSNN